MVARRSAECWEIIMVSMQMARDTPTHLAIEGGEPLRKTPFAPWPYFSHEEIEAATRILESGRVNYWTGQEGRQLKKSSLHSRAASTQWH